jgi:nucleotide-binding universal stress UspA family protein
VNILIATAGALPPGPVAELIAGLVGPADKVRVITVLEVPRSFLNELRKEEWRPLTEDGSSWDEEQDAVIARYVEERGRRLTDPLLAALASHDVPAEAEHLEGEDKAKTIVEAAAAMGANLVVIGATRHIFAESAWESITGRVMATVSCPVLVVPNAPTPDTDPDDLD